jgi:hypothetical protein
MDLFSTSGLYHRESSCALHSLSESLIHVLSSHGGASVNSGAGSRKRSVLVYYTNAYTNEQRPREIF